MRLRFLISVIAAGTLLISVLGQSAPDSTFLSDAALREILTERVNAKQALGIVVGTIGPRGPRVIAVGDIDTNDNRQVSGDTIFGIGAITEIFTSLLLEDMAQRGEVALADPVEKYLPKTVTMPERGRKITLQDLATHVSGLPRNPTNLSPKDLKNPYADYTTKQLYQFLSSYHLDREPGSTWEYSNLGPGLLGQVLALRSHQTYESLVRTRITGPLAMKSTGITFSRELASRQGIAHDAQFGFIPTWDFQTMAGAGALRSTANDLLSFLGAVLGYSKSPLAPALAAMVKVRRPTSWTELENAIGWQVNVLDGNEIVRKDGGTLGFSNYGYSTFIGYDPKARTGVVVLSNASTLMGVDDIGMHLLDPRYPLRGRNQKAVAVDPKRLDGLVGSYQLSPSSAIVVTRTDNQLFAQLGAQPKFEIFPQSDFNYFYKAFDAQLTFEPDAQGKGNALILHYNGRHQRAKRVVE